MGNHHVDKRVLLAALLIVASFVYLFLLMHLHPAVLPTPIVVLKLPRSGSSWFSDLLNSQPDVYITKEIIQHHDQQQDDQNLNEQQQRQHQHHLSKALKAPMSKFTNRRFKYLSGRFWEDYMLPFKFVRTLRFVGFTLNPENVPSLNWFELFKSNPTTKLIILIRVNVIKSAVSGFVGNKMKQVCGLSNMYSNHSFRHQFYSNCNDVNNDAFMVDWNTTVFKEEINRWQLRYASYYRHLQSILTDYHKVTTFKPVVVTYEHLQANKTVVMNNLLQTLNRAHFLRHYQSDLPPSDVTSTFLSSASSSSFTMASEWWSSMNVFVLQSTWQKRNPDNLRLLLTHFEPILNSLLSHPSCACLKNQLLALAPTKETDLKSLFCSVLIDDNNECKPIENALDVKQIIR